MVHACPEGVLVKGGYPILGLASILFAALSQDFWVHAAMAIRPGSWRLKRLELRLWCQCES